MKKTHELIKNIILSAIEQKTECLFTSKTNGVTMFSYRYVTELHSTLRLTNQYTDELLSKLESWKDNFKIEYISVSYTEDEVLIMKKFYVHMDGCYSVEKNGVEIWKGISAKFAMDAFNES